MLAGDSQASAVLKLAPITDLGRVPRLNVTSRTLTLADTRSGILSSTGSGSCALLVPTMAAMGYTRNDSNPVDLMFVFQRCGLGGIFVNADTGVTIHWNDLDPQYLTRYHRPVSLIAVATDTWAAC